MRMVDIIEKKRYGKALTTEEINFFIDGYTKGDIPDYQASALAMAIVWQDMNERERGDLTMAMARSGDMLDLSGIEGIKVDKHSTGGVGDTTTLILAPLVASVGVPVAKMSGRGLGHTGGTIDKLEAIPHFRTDLAEETFIDLVNTHKLAVVGQTGNLTPADKKLYALRDVTGTVNSIPLIASSVMSKKLAAGAEAIVLDVKVGAGAFMKTEAEAEELAQAMVAIGNQVGRKTVAVISDMSQPLGVAVGNALEVKEAIAVLKGEGPADTTELCLVLGAEMVVLAGKAPNRKVARQLLEDALYSGRALTVFKEFITRQGGEVAVVDNVDLLPTAPYQIPIKAAQDGYVTALAADEIGLCAMLLGAGRATKEDIINPAVGIVLHKKVGDAVTAGEVLATMHSETPENRAVVTKLTEAIQVGANCQVPTLIHSIITGEKA